MTVELFSVASYFFQLLPAEPLGNWHLFLKAIKG